MPWDKIIPLILPLFVFLGGGLTSYFHYRAEARLQTFKAELIDTISAKFVNREVADLQYQLQDTKIDNVLDLLKQLKIDVLARVERIERARN